MIAMLSDKNESAVLDLYINCTQNVTLSCKGGSDVHLSGYFEPKGDDMDDDMFYGNEDGDEEAEDEEDEPVVTKGKQAAKPSVVEQNIK